MGDNNNQVGTGFFPQTSINTYDLLNNTQNFTPYLRPATTSQSYQTNNYLAPILPEPKQSSWWESIVGAVSGYVGQFTNLQNRAINDGYQAFQKAYNHTVTSSTEGKSGLLVDAANNGMKATLETYSNLGINPLNIFGANLAKAYSYTLDLSLSGAESLRLPVSEILSRIQRQESPGDYVARIMRHDSLSDLNTDKLSRGEIAWFSPLEEIIGYNLNRDALLKDTGFPANFISDESAGDRVIMIYRAEDLGDLVPATWDGLRSKASSSDAFIKFQSQDPELWKNLQEFDYSNHSKLAASFSSSLDYAATLAPFEKNLFEARSLLDTKYGANEYFSGKGYTQSYDGQIGYREFAADNLKIADLTEHAYLNLSAKDGHVTSSLKLPKVPDHLLTKGDHIYGGLFSALSGMGFEAYSRFNNYSQGKITSTDALKDLPEALLKAGGLGAGIGISSVALEKQLMNTNTLKALESKIASTSLIPAAIRSGENLTGQFARQIGGSTGSGAIIGGLISAVEESGRYMNGEISGAKAIGSITAEAGMGAASATTGILAGGLASSMAGAGSIAGPAGFVVGLAVGAGTDWVLRETGADVWISNQVESAANVVGNSAQDAWDWLTDW